MTDNCLVSHNEITLRSILNPPPPPPPPRARESELDDESPPLRAGRRRDTRAIKTRGDKTRCHSRCVSLPAFPWVGRWLLRSWLQDPVEKFQEISFRANGRARRGGMRGGRMERDSPDSRGFEYACLCVRERERERERERGKKDGSERQTGRKWEKELYTFRERSFLVSHASTVNEGGCRSIRLSWIEAIADRSLHVVPRCRAAGWNKGLDPFWRGLECRGEYQRRRKRCRRKRSNEKSSLGSWK